MILRDEFYTDTVYIEILTIWRVDHILVNRRVGEQSRRPRASPWRTRSGSNLWEWSEGRGCQGCHLEGFWEDWTAGHRCPGWDRIAWCNCHSGLWVVLWILRCTDTCSIVGMRQQRPRATRELVLWGGSWCRVEDGGGSRCDFEGVIMWVYGCIVDLGSAIFSMGAWVWITKVVEV